MQVIQPYQGDRIDKAFDSYYDQELDKADTGTGNVRDTDRQLFRNAVEKFMPDPQVKALETTT